MFRPCVFLERKAESCTDSEMFGDCKVQNSIGVKRSDMSELH